MMARICLVFAAGVFILACAEEPTSEPRVEGPTLSLEIGALTLTGVADAVWDIEVRNGLEPSQRVWAQRITSSQFGDSAGSASYVGPCDASDGADQNVVNVTLLGVYSETLTESVGTFNDEHEGAPEGEPIQNPGTMSKPFTCVANGDTFVRFDVVVLRPASQGFIDIAVNFNNVFCSAKLDCLREDDTELRLLHRDDGTRGPTAVIGFACSAGTGAGIDTVLALNHVQIDCWDGFSDGFEASARFSPDTDGWVDLDGGAGGFNFSWSDFLDDGDPAQPILPLFGASVARGVELLPGLNKAYWNILLGYNAIGSCILYLDGTVLDGRVDENTPPGVTYPYIYWDVELTDWDGERACSQHPLGEPDCVFDGDELLYCDGVDIEYFVPTADTGEGASKALNYYFPRD